MFGLKNVNDVSGIKCIVEVKLYKIFLGRWPEETYQEFEKFFGD